MHFFFIFSKFWFSGLLGGNKAKNVPKWIKILSVALHISGTIHHMIFIYGTHMCFLHFFKILVFQVVSVVKGPKMAQNDNWFCCPSYLRSHTSYYCDFRYICVKWWHVQFLFSYFQKFAFLGNKARKRAKKGSKSQKSLSYSVSQELHLIWLWFLVHMV